MKVTQLTENTFSLSILFYIIFLVYVIFKILFQEGTRRKARADPGRALPPTLPRARHRLSREAHSVPKQGEC